MLLAWAFASVVLVTSTAPAWMKVPVVGPFTTLGVGMAVLLRLPGVSGLVAVAVTLVAGLGSLMLLSEIVVYAGLWRTWGALGVVVTQALLVAVLVMPGAVVTRPRARRASAEEH